MLHAALYVLSGNGSHVQAWDTKSGVLLWDDVIHAMPVQLLPSFQVPLPE